MAALVAVLIMLVAVLAAMYAATRGRVAELNGRIDEMIEATWHVDQEHAGAIARLQRTNARVIATAARHVRRRYEAEDIARSALAAGLEECEALRDREADALHAMNVYEASVDFHVGLVGTWIRIASGLCAKAEENEQIARLAMREGLKACDDARATMRLALHHAKYWQGKYDVVIAATPPKASKRPTTKRRKVAA